MIHFRDIVLGEYRYLRLFYICASYGKSLEMFRFENESALSASENANEPFIVVLRATIIRIRQPSYSFRGIMLRNNVKYFVIIVGREIAVRCI